MVEFVDIRELMIVGGNAGCICAAGWKGSDIVSGSVQSQVKCKERCCRDMGADVYCFIEDVESMVKRWQACPAFSICWIC